MLLHITSTSIGIFLLFAVFALPVYAVPTLIPVLGVFGVFLIKIIFFGASIAFFSFSAITKGNRKYYTVAASVCLVCGIAAYIILR